MTWIAIFFEDGTVGRMQFFGENTDQAIQAEIDKSAFHAPVRGWQRHADFPADKTTWRTAITGRT